MAPSAYLELMALLYNLVLPKIKIIGFERKGALFVD